MQIDLTDLAPGSELDTDVCVVGAGAAGQSVVRGLLGSGLKILLLESGGFDFDADIQALGAGDNLGAPYYDLVDSRLRFFGGTTSIWGGRCAPVDPIDLEPRPWAGTPGWPIRMEDLTAGYHQAHSVLGIGDFDYGDSLWSHMGRAYADRVRPTGQAPVFDRQRIDYGFWRFDFEKERFGARQCRDLLLSDQVTLLLHANVVALTPMADGGVVKQLELRGPDGRAIVVRSRIIVLACGGIENPRLLLASRGVESAGLGNRHDQVGRCFMEHPHGRLGRIHGPNGLAIWDAFRMRHPRGHVPVAPALRIAAECQRQQGLLNSAVTFKLQRDPERGVPRAKALYQSLKHDLSPTNTNRRLWHWYRDTRLLYREWLRPQVERLKAGRGDRVLSVMVRGEQAPNPASRVLLSDRVDRHGVPLANLDWRFSEIDKHTVRTLGNLLDGELRRTGLGRLEVEEWVASGGSDWPVDPTVGNHPLGGFHHMGTTRMSSDPRQGVVDANCAVHGYANLFVAGSSVFPTSGWANPTLTIMALAFRLAGHIRSLPAG